MIGELQWKWIIPLVVTAIAIYVRGLGYHANLYLKVLRALTSPRLTI